eukprot:759960-Hanusia_phi.AAC.1
MCIRDSPPSLPLSSRALCELSFYSIHVKDHCLRDPVHGHDAKLKESEPRKHGTRPPGSGDRRGPVPVTQFPGCGNSE